MIQLHEVTRSYQIEKQTVDALRGVSLRIPQGTRAAITGKSGAGKSTLLHIVGLLDKASSGRVILNDTDVSNFSDQAASQFRNATVGFIFQMNNLLAEFSAAENVMMPGLIAGASRGAVRERAMSLLRAVGLQDRERHRPGELSGGEQQRVAIARALLMNPPILLADEPTGNLDKKTSHSIQDLLMNLAEGNKMTVVLVTHDLDLAKRLPTQVVMEDGKVVSGGGLD